jgi:hypothetical protein
VLPRRQLLQAGALAFILEGLHAVQRGFSVPTQHLFCESKTTNTSDLYLIGNTKRVHYKDQEVNVV